MKYHRGVRAVQRVSLRYFYHLGQAIHPLTDGSALAADKKVIDVYGVLSGAGSQLDGLFNSVNFVSGSLKSSWESGRALQATLRRILSREDWNSELGFMDMYAIQSEAKEFETKFTGELHYSDAYFVVQKGGLDTAKIITDATILFPPDLGAKAPYAVADIREAGKCIAFELSTGAGFHLLRAVETVLRVYFEAVTGSKNHPRPRTLGKYLERMRKLKKGDPKVLAVLDQIRDLHRNPLMHPEEVLTVEDALNLYGIARSAIAAMLVKIPMPAIPLTPPPPPPPVEIASTVVDAAVSEAASE